MCAIFGLGFMRGHKVNSTEMVRAIVRRLFIENQVRGGTAAGLAFINSRVFHVVKKDVRGEKLITLPEYEEAEKKYMVLSDLPEGEINTVVAKEPPLSFIGHCRLKTKGSELDNVNNHPIVRDEVVGVHNGMIGNDDRIFDIYEKTFDRNGRVDSEIIFALIEHFSKDAEKPIHKAVQKTSKALRGGMACAFAHRRHPHIVWLFRRGGPCAINIYRDVGLVAWSSMRHYIEHSVKGYEDVLGKAEVVGLEEGEGMSIDLHRNYIYRFGMEEYGANGNTLSAV